MKSCSPNATSTASLQSSRVLRQLWTELQKLETCLKDLILNLFELALVVCRLNYKLIPLLLQIWPFLGYHHPCNHAKSPFRLQTIDVM